MYLEIYVVYVCLTFSVGVTIQCWGGMVTLIGGSLVNKNAVILCVVASNSATTIFSNCLH